MKNQSEKQAASPALSTPTILVLAVGGVLILYMFLQPMFAPKDKMPAPASGNAPVTEDAQPVTEQPAPANPADSQAVEGAKAASGTNPDQTAPTANQAAKRESVSDRDPFVPSAVLARGPVVDTKTEIATSAQEPRTEKPVAQVRSVIKPTVQSNVKSETPLSQDHFVWKGIVGGQAAQQVVLIQHNARTYILREGDPVPGTKYKVAEVTTEMVVLASPDKQLRLAKKKEAKING